ncbi:hypothetical protein HNY73_000140 [Argiope bruennichi]|uniref:Uncharacterized protein n=1 Tax=Argiope bruennichi TaxID=94029 RepID=A0A8T0FZP6_ARGBR|nr:hypothetical protein HNY73_000140 [Argiope bruennichi]
MQWTFDSDAPKIDGRMVRKWHRRSQSARTSLANPLNTRSADVEGNQLDKGRSVLVDQRRQGKLTRKFISYDRCEEVC